MNKTCMCGLAALLAIGPACAQSGKSNAPATPAAPPSADLPLVLLLMPPALMVNSVPTRSGCWAKLYDHKDYLGDSMTLAGPVALTQMRDVFGLHWRDRVRSIEIGPKTTVTVYDNANFRDRVAQFTPGQRYPDLSKRMGFFDDFGSLQLACPAA